MTTRLLMQGRVRTLAAQHGLSLPRPFHSGFDLAPHFADFAKLAVAEDRFLARLREIESDARTTEVGKNDHRAEAGIGFKADAAALRVRMTAISGRRDHEMMDLLGSVERPKPSDPAVAIMSQRLLAGSYTTQEIALLHHTGTESDRLTIEAVAAASPRIPRRAPEGGVVWEELLPVALIKKSTMERAERANPTAAHRVRDIDALLEVYDQLAQTAHTFVDEVMLGYGIRLPEQAFTDPRTGRTLDLA